MAVITEKSTLCVVCFLIIEILTISGLLLFVITAITSNLNIGNAAGILFCGCILFICIKRQWLADIISSAMKTTMGKTIFITVIVIISVAVITALVLSVFMVKAMNRVPDKPATVIVLGCRVKENGPSFMLEKRIITAYEYLNKNPETICIASGGQGLDEPVTESSAIKKRLIEFGISSERIIEEKRSTNTFENIKYSLEIMEKLGLEKRAVIITSEFHQLRAGIIAQKQGLEHYSKSSSTFAPLLLTYWIREWFGVLHELIIGRK